MSIYHTTVSQLPPALKDRVTVVPNLDALNRRIAAEFADALQAKTERNELLTVIAPVGPVDYGYFAQETLRRGLSCRNLRTINMDEYLDADDRLIPESHPLSFRRFMNETFFNKLPGDKRPLPENIVFPLPDRPGEVTALIDGIGGADLCWCGFGISGHVAFNDPPAMLGEPADLESFRNSKARKLTVSPMSTAQMLMGGTNGNYEALPSRAVTLGMYELLKTKRMHCTFMRNWHAGLWRRAFLGPVTTEFPGSLLQEHPNLIITMTELAAAVPMANAFQETGETK